MSAQWSLTGENGYDTDPNSVEIDPTATFDGAKSTTYCLKSENMWA